MSTNKVLGVAKHSLRMIVVYLDAWAILWPIRVLVVKMVTPNHVLELHVLIVSWKFLEFLELFGNLEIFGNFGNLWNFLKFF
jgi:hypothetical protein